MNVREMLEEIPKRYPSARLKTEGFPPGLDYYFQVILSNKWVISCGYDEIHYSEGGTLPPCRRLESRTLELAIFKPDGSWYQAESMTSDVVLGWQDSEQVFRILEFISMKGPK